jgi:hypothetical protein
MTTNHPVYFRLERMTHFARIHVVIRLALFAAVSAIGCLAFYWVLYFALPALIAAVVSHKGGSRYLAEDAPRIVRMIRWLAGAYAYLWLLTDVLPTADTGGAVQLEVEPDARVTPGSALWRLLSTLPALLVASVLALAGGLLWVVGAIWVLAVERMPSVIGDFLAMSLRYQARLTAYHLSLVDRYPTFEESSPVHAPA